MEIIIIIIIKRGPNKLKIEYPFHYPSIYWMVRSFIPSTIHPSIHSFIFVLVVVVVVVRCSSGEALRSNLCGKNLSRLPKSCFSCVCVGEYHVFLLLEKCCV